MPKSLFDADTMLDDEKILLFSSLKSGAKHDCGLKLTQRQCQFLEHTLMRSVDITIIMESLSTALQNNIISWQKSKNTKNESNG